MRLKSTRIASFLLTGLLLPSCASLGSFEGNTPIRVGLPHDLWQAHEAVTALGVIQNAAITLNSFTVCDPPPKKLVCGPYFSDRNTRRVIVETKVALDLIDIQPGLWKQALLTAVDRLDEALAIGDEADRKLLPYFAAARIVAGLRILR